MSDAFTLALQGYVARERAEQHAAKIWAIVARRRVVALLGSWGRL